jgi:epoxyqueuosine reductase QueG
VLVYFLPLTPVSAGTSKDGTESSVYDKGFSLTKLLIPQINAHMAEYIKAIGYNAVIPTNTSPVSREIMVSRWSEKHVGAIAGVGTFGLNRQLISDFGCTGRISTLITDLPIEADEKIAEERCLYKRNGSCGLCVKRCPSGALTETEISPQICMKHNSSLGNNGQRNKCARCSRGLPCSYRVP